MRTRPIYLDHAAGGGSGSARPESFKLLAAVALLVVAGVAAAWGFGLFRRGPAKLGPAEQAKREQRFEEQSQAEQEQQNQAPPRERPIEAGG